MPFQNPKGTTDFYPEENAVKEEVFRILKDTALKFGFQEVDVPVLESLELLKAKQGEEIVNQIFTLEKKGNEELAMRAEFTPSFARMFMAKQKEIQKPVKWFCINKVWRYERPQAGRLREFFQFNAEIFGSDKPEADTEVVLLIVSSLLNLGLKETDFIFKINNRKLLQGLLEDFVPEEKIDELIRVIDKKSKVSEKDFIEMLEEVGVKEPNKLLYLLEIKDIKKIERLKLNWRAEEGLKEIKPILEMLSNFDCVKLDLSTVRGLAYYTGTVFEVYDKKEELRAICGGGRYDKMIESFGGEPTPATGFGMGYATLYLLLEKCKCLPKLDISCDYYIIPVSEKELKFCIETANKLRKKYKVNIDLMRRSVSKNMQFANKISAKKVILIGESEIKSKKFTVKDMKTGKEEKLSINEL